MTARPILASNVSAAYPRYWDGPPGKRTGDPESAGFAAWVRSIPLTGHPKSFGLASRVRGQAPFSKGTSS